MSVADKGIDFGPPHFKIAIHAIVMLAQRNCLLSSSTIADRVDSHATFLRRVLQTLSQAGIVESKGGRDGGYRLRSDPSKLTLGEVYEAVHAGRPDSCTEAAIQSGCGEAGQLLDWELERILHEAETHTIRYLQQFTIEHVISNISLFSNEQH